MNNVALWTGKPASPYIPFVNIAPIVAGINGISIFPTTVDVTGGIGIDPKNWRKQVDVDSLPVLNDSGDPILEEVYSVATAPLTINTKTKKLCKGDEELVDIVTSLTPQKVEFMKAGTICDCVW